MSLSEEIADIIYNKLNYMYCDNCRYDSEKDCETEGDFTFDPCEECHRKSNGWAISKATCELIASKICKVIDESKL